MDTQNNSQPDEGAHTSESLEESGTIVEPGNSPNISAGTTDAVDATGGKNDSSSQPQSNKPSFIKRLWQKFNVYLLLFLLVILIAAAVTVVLFFKNRDASNASKEILNSQTLSTEALKQIAETNIDVGTTNQVLNVKSNSIFTGAVLIQSDLEVAGSLKVGREMQLSNITVAGTGRFSQIQTDVLAVGSNAAVQGSLTVQKGITVNGNGSFTGSISAAQITTGSLQLNNDLTLTRHIVAGGPIPNVTRGNAVGTGGTVSVGGSDTAGSLTINTGSGTAAGCFAAITFTARFSSTPHVIITPIGSGAAGIDYYVNRSASEFSVCTTNPAPAGQTFGFDYMVID